MFETGKKKNIILMIFLLPTIIGMFLFMVFPIILGVITSFMEWNLISDPEFVGLENYVTILTDKDFILSVIRSFIFLFLYVGPVVFISFLIATLLNQKVKFQIAFRSMFFLPVVASWVAVSIVWSFMYNVDYGLINYVLSLFGVQGPDWLNNPYTALISVVITTIWKDVGFMAIILLAALQNIPDELYEAASLDGVSGIKRLFRITLPCIMPQLFLVIIISSISAFQVFDQIMIMTAGGPGTSSTTAMIEIYNNAFSYGKYGIASAMSLVFFILIFIYSLIMQKIQGRFNYYEEN